MLNVCGFGEREFGVRLDVSAFGLTPKIHDLPGECAITYGSVVQSPRSKFWRCYINMSFSGRSRALAQAYALERNIYVTRLLNRKIKTKNARKNETRKIW